MGWGGEGRGFHLTARNPSHAFHSIPPPLPTDQTHISWQHPVLVLYVASMVVDEIQVGGGAFGECVPVGGQHAQ